MGVLSTAALGRTPVRSNSLAARATGQMRGLAPAADYLFDPGLVYLNTGSLGPTPQPVLDRTVAAWKDLERNPVFYGYSKATRAMDEVRAKAAAFVKCKTDELVLTRCTTDGMNWVAQGLTWSASSSTR
jgi:selenocysteine lyase/cysteine desulfurase